jgi:hypothetical protein
MVAESGEGLRDVIQDRVTLSDQAARSSGNPRAWWPIIPAAALARDVSTGASVAIPGLRTPGVDIQSRCRSRAVGGRGDGVRWCLRYGCGFDVQARAQGPKFIIVG